MLLRLFIKIFSKNKKSKPCLETFISLWPSNTIYRSYMVRGRHNVGTIVRKSNECNCLHTSQGLINEVLISCIERVPP